MKHQQDLAVVDERRDFLPMGDPGHKPEIGRAGKAREELSGINPGVLIPDRIGNVVQVEGCGITEYEQLDEGGNDEDRPAFLVSEKGQEFLSREFQNPDESLLHSIRFRLIRWMTANRNTEKRIRAIEFGMMTPGMFPARKTDWRIVTK